MPLDVIERFLVGMMQWSFQSTFRNRALKMQLTNGESDLG
jgi:hypothetical protein